jgi:hypothetical protein
VEKEKLKAVDLSDLKTNSIKLPLCICVGRDVVLPRADLTVSLALGKGMRPWSFVLRAV